MIMCVKSLVLIYIHWHYKIAIVDSTHIHTTCELLCTTTPFESLYYWWHENFEGRAYPV